MRISRQQMFAEMATTASKRATCYRANVGAIIVEGNNVISIGYNGPPSGEPHCLGKALCPLTSNGGCSRAVHAEDNAIKRMANREYGPFSCDLYTTRSPCETCTELILKTLSIGRIFYIEQYRNTNHLDRLRGKKEILRILPSGVVLDHFTGEVVEPEDSYYRAGIAKLFG